MKQVGEWLRFITPILVSIGLWTMTQINGKMDKIEVGFENHLEHHRVAEVLQGERMASIETQLRFLRR